MRKVVCILVSLAAGAYMAPVFATRGTTPF